MATLNQYVYQVLDTANKGMSNRAGEVGPRLVAAWIDKYRNFLVAQEIKRSGEIDSSLEQDLGCLVLTKADKAVCSTYNWCESVYYVDLPTPLELPNNSGLTYFGLIDKQTRIPISEYSYGSYSNFNRFAPKRIYGEMIGSRVYLHNVDEVFPIEVVNARGVWATPSSLTTQSSPTAPIKCFDWNVDEYPMLSKLDAILFDMIYQRELGIVRTATNDTTDDDTTTETL